MKKILMIMLIALLAFGTLFAEGQAETAETADSYPTKPMKVIVEYNAGGSTDMLGRAIASIIPKYLDQPMVVENRPGGSGMIGVDAVLKAKADGYTLGTTSSGPFTTVPMTQKAPYDPVNDVKFIATFTLGPIIVCASADAPWDDLTDLVADAKAAPGKYIYGQNAPGGTTHIAMEIFRATSGIDMKMIPYNSGSEVAAALLGGHVDTGTLSPAEASEHVKAGTLKMLGVFNPGRMADYPDIKTALEQGYDVQVAVPKGIFAPAGISDDIAEKLEAALEKVYNDEEFKAIVKQIGLAPELYWMNMGDSQKFMKGLYDSMKPVVEELGLGN
ncbi:MAG: tripartite tricarboxylate transporter substrate binding protein [Sphaerochaetaceae bacterium]|nr:tripartite tricarboxylate transporter substrate binding protein [Sphaerochaetaceae bacterium]